MYGPRFLRPIVFGLLFAGLSWPGTSSAQTDSDSDGVPDSADAFPCDATRAGASYAPAQDVHGMLMFEDMWPSAGDLDFNDVVLSYNFEHFLDGQGRVVSIRATFNPLAVGGSFDNGFGLHIPVAASAVATVTRRLEGGQPQNLAISTADNQLTVVVSNNLRELFAGRTGPINSAGSTTVDATRFEVNITFTTPVVLATSGAPYDVYIFRSADHSHQIHRPEYAGTADMATSLFGTINDGSTTGRYFVDNTGLPFALVLPTTAVYPAESNAISSLFPNIATFASSGGAQARDFYSSSVVSSRSYAGTPLSPRFVTTTTVDRSCVPTQVPAGYAIFTASGTFTPPSGVANVRVLAVGGGGGGGGGHNGGGGGGFVQYGAVSVSGPIAIAVGAGGTGAGGANDNSLPSGTNGQSSSFGTLVVAAGGQTTPGGNTRGGNGGTGGGGSGNAGTGAAGGINGAGGGSSTYPGGTGQGSYSSMFSNFATNTISAGAGGAGGVSSHGGGGGGGGVVIAGQGPSGQIGADYRSGGGGVGYGGGGGGGGCCQSTPTRAGGGNGASGVVYVEWSSQNVTPPPSGGGGGIPSGTNFAIATTSGVWTPPAGVTSVRVFAIGGGGGGGGGHNGGGGSGYVASGTFSVSGPVNVTVGNGGTGAMGSPDNNQPSGTDGGASSFGSFLSANGGQTTPGGNTRGGHGGSGGGGSGNAGVGAAGATNGGTGSTSTYPGGNGQGSFASHFNLMSRVALTAGAGGAGGTSSHGGGGGGGGVVVAGAGPSGQTGADSNSARGGQGYGGGGGGGGCCQSTPTRAGGGTGAPGAVIIEWN